MELDDWQKEILETEGNICLRSGRQVGKSTIISIKAAEYAVKNREKTILIIASVERQASLLFEKTLGYLFDNYKEYITKGKDKPTKHIIKLKNGSVIHCLPTGLSGNNIRGYTVDLLIADEAAFIEKAVFVSVTPSLAATGGSMWLLSTPFGTKDRNDEINFFYSCFSNPNFKNFHISTLEVAEKRPEPQRSAMLEHIKEAERTMTKLAFQQEYLGLWVDKLRQFFSDNLINEVMTISRQVSNIPLPVGSSFLGVDIARMGEDKSCFVSVIRTPKKKVVMTDMLVTQKNFLTDTIANIKALHKKYNYKKIYVDNAGLGAGVFDVLLEDVQTKSRVVPILNSQKSLDADDEKKGKVMKETLYTNLLWLMENKQISLFIDDDLRLALRSIQYEYNDKGHLMFLGHSADLVEALVRAAYCAKDKTLNVWAA